MFEDVNEVKTPEENSQFHYYYSREKRLEHAPQIVKDNYAGKMKPPSAFKALFGNKGSRFIIIALVAVLAISWLSNGVGRNRHAAVIGNLSLDAMAFAYEEEIYVSLKIDEQKKSKISCEPKKAKEITADFVFIDVDGQISNKNQSTLEYIQGEQYLRTKASDYDIIRVDVIVQVDDEQKELSAKVKR